MWTTLRYYTILCTLDHQEDFVTNISIQIGAELFDQSVPIAELLQGVEGEAITNILPIPLQGAGVPIVHQGGNHLQLWYLVDVYIYMKGDPGHTYYIILRGSVSILLPKEEVLMEMPKETNQGAVDYVFILLSNSSNEWHRIVHSS